MPGFAHYRPAKWIRVSALNDYMRCPRLYFYKYGVGLVSGELRLALHFGEGIHAAIGYQLGHLHDKDVLAGMLAAFDRVWTEEMEAQRDTKMGKNRNRAVAVKVLMHWLLTHKPGQMLWNPQPPPKMPGDLRGIAPESHQSDMEVPFAVDIGEKIMLVGRIDCLSTHRDTGLPWLTEFKTASAFTWWMMPNAFDNNTQALSYNLAMHLMGIDTVGTMIELIKVDDKSQDNQCIPLYLPKWKIQEHLSLVRWKIGELLEFERRQSFPKDFSACNTYSKFGSPGFPCDFTRLCNTPDWTTFKDLYKIQPDRPFDIPLEVIQ